MAKFIGVLDHAFKHTLNFKSRFIHFGMFFVCNYRFIGMFLIVPCFANWCEFLANYCEGLTLGLRMRLYSKERLPKLTSKPSFIFVAFR